MRAYLIIQRRRRRRHLASGNLGVDRRDKLYGYPFGRPRSVQLTIGDTLEFPQLQDSNEYGENILFIPSILLVIQSFQLFIHVSEKV